VLRFLTGLAEWLVYDALGSLSPSSPEPIDDGGVDPLA
jgi:hypothetical protein